MCMYSYYAHVRFANLKLVCNMQKEDTGDDLLLTICARMKHLPFLEKSSPSWLQMLASSLKLLLFCALFFAFWSSDGQSHNEGMYRTFI